MLALATLAGACSVSTPRREAVGLRANRQTAVGADGQTLALDENGAPVAGATADAAGSGSGGGTSRSGGAGATAATAGANRTAPVAAGGASATGVTKDTITVSIVAGFSGVLSAVVARAYDALLT